jgi:hypothetical protein
MDPWAGLGRKARRDGSHLKHFVALNPVPATASEGANFFNVQ